MTQTIAYLTFNGNCRQAMTFYQQCLGGELYLQTVGASPAAEGLPGKLKEYILHSSLEKGGIRLLGTDMVPEPGLVRGNAVSIFLQCESESELNAYYEKLSEGGKSLAVPATTFSGSFFGELTDRYGNHWLLSFYPGKAHKDEMLL